MRITTINGHKISIRDIILESNNITYYLLLIGISYY